MSYASEGPTATEEMPPLYLDDELAEGDLADEDYRGNNLAAPAELDARASRKMEAMLDNPY